MRAADNAKAANSFLPRTLRMAAGGFYFLLTFHDGQQEKQHKRSVFGSTCLALCGVNTFIGSQ